MKKKNLSDPIVKNFLKRVSNFKDEIYSIYLFGSRARDNFSPDSDYDILIVLKNKDKKVIHKLYGVVLDILLSTGKFISLKVFNYEEFKRLKSIPTPFMNNVIKEGTNLG